MKMTDTRPEEDWMTGVKETEHASLVCLEDGEPVRELEAAIAQTGALEWDGYKESNAMKGVDDSGDSYELYFELSDGSSVRVEGYNVCPDGYMELLGRTAEIFEANSDYSSYVSESFDASECVSLFAKFTHGNRTEYRIELFGNRWVVYLADPEGRILKAGTQVADYRDVEGKLPYERFVTILDAHDAKEWNGYDAKDPGSDSYFVIRLTFADGKSFEASGYVFPEGFEEMKQEFVLEIERFYREMEE